MSARPVGPDDGVAWVTGASSGIGAALVRRLAADGWRVAASARSADKLNALEAESDGAVRAFACDVVDADAVAATVAGIEAEMGPIALAVLNAGVYLPIKAEAPDAAAMKKTFDVNLGGAAACLAALNPRLAGRRRGQIALVASATGFGGMPTAAAYGASKAALINMAETLRLELDRWGVLVQVVTPGFVDTPAQDGNAFPKPFMVSPETAAARIARGLASRRFEITFPRRFTWALKAIYALPRGIWLPLVRAQTGWAAPLDENARPNVDCPVEPAGPAA